MALVDSLRKATKKAIDKFGGDVTVRIVTVGAYNTTDGTASESNSDTTVKGVLQPSNTLQRASAGLALLLP